MVKASDNIFPKVQLSTAIASAAPSGGTWRMEARADGIYAVSSNTGSGGTGPFSAGAAGAVATDAIWDVAGDLVQGTGANTAARLALGTALQVLRVNAGATAAEWAAAAGGSTLAAASYLRTTGSYTSSSDVFADIDATNMALTITTGARRVLIGFSASGSSATAGQYVALDFTVDGTRQFGGLYGRMLRQDSGAYPDHLDMTFLTAVLTAGSHTFKVQWRNTDNVTAMTILADGTNYAAQFYVMEQGG